MLIIIICSNDRVIPITDVLFKFRGFYPESIEGISSERQVDRGIRSVTQLYEGLRQLSRISRLLAIHPGSEVTHITHGFRVVGDDLFAADQRTFVEEVGAEESGSNHRGINSQGANSIANASVIPSMANFVDP